MTTSELERSPENQSEHGVEQVCGCAAEPQKQTRRIQGDGFALNSEPPLQANGGPGSNQTPLSAAV
jgi:hypothetical protein